ncbi:MAG: hypothetical protein ACOY3P_18025 [Planctomycetota bacterium]
MSRQDAVSSNSLGFLTVVEHADHGLFGGYLVLDFAGRPLEFHCTAPVKPNRAQEILYGPTLQGFLFGEQIGQTLIQQTKKPPRLVCTDRLPAMSARGLVASPLALVMPPESITAEPVGGETGGRFFRVDGPHLGTPRLAAFTVGSRRLAVCQSHAEDQQQAAECVAELAEGFDLAEPFERIRAAIEEAQQAAR